MKKYGGHAEKEFIFHYQQGLIFIQSYDGIRKGFLLIL